MYVLGIDKSSLEIKNSILVASFSELLLRREENQIFRLFSSGHRSRSFKTFSDGLKKFIPRSYVHRTDRRRHNCSKNPIRVIRSNFAFLDQAFFQVHQKKAVVIFTHAPLNRK